MGSSRWFSLLLALDVRLSVAVCLGITALQQWTLELEDEVNPSSPGSVSKHLDTQSLTPLSIPSWSMVASDGGVWTATPDVNARDI